MSIEQEITSLIEDHLDTVYDIQDKSSLEALIQQEVENGTLVEGDVLDMVTNEVTCQLRDLSDEYELLTQYRQYAAIQSRLDILESSNPTVSENQIDWIIPPNSIFAGYSDLKHLESYISASGADNAQMIVAMAMATARNVIAEILVEKGANKNEQ